VRDDDAKQTVRPGSSDHLLLTLARLETLSEEHGKRLFESSKVMENRILHVHQALGDLSKAQGSIVSELSKLSVISRHNADQIMELKSGQKDHWEYLRRIEKEVDLVHATQKTCEARNFWHELQSAYNEDSKVIEVMRQKLKERKVSTPPDGFSVRISGNKATLSGPMKLVILALLGALLGAGATAATVTSFRGSSTVSERSQP
jgi:regulator of replication initiation timing